MVFDEIEARLEALLRDLAVRRKTELAEEFVALAAPADGEAWADAAARLMRRPLLEAERARLNDLKAFARAYVVSGDVSDRLPRAAAAPTPNAKGDTSDPALRIL